MKKHKTNPVISKFDSFATAASKAMGSTAVFLAVLIWGLPVLFLIIVKLGSSSSIQEQLLLLF
ncbi:hypothetical protein [Flavobacterium marginilacus]|uniref:hypothetical protein n=1 Tax=Flavobacterium marginilacus TaxID=3003256 RepID=UPI0032C3F26C